MTINPLRLSTVTESQARKTNSRNNIIAVGTKNGFTSRVPLKLTSSYGTEVHASEPRGFHASVGTIQNIDVEVSDSSLFQSMPSTLPIRGLR